MLLATVVSAGCLVLGTSCKPKSNVVKEPKTINVKLYKAGFGDEFLMEFQDKFNAAFKDEGYVFNISSALYDNAGDAMLQEMYAGYEEYGIDLYITGAIAPNQVSEIGLYGDKGDLCIDLRESVFNQPAINYDGTYTSEKISDRIHEDLVPFLCADNGKMYGFTWAQTSAGMVVNTKKLATYGITELPRTSNELFEAFDTILAQSSTTLPYPLTYTLDNGATYQNTAMSMWFAQFGVDTYNEFLRLQTKNPDGSWTDMANGYEVYDNPHLVDAFEAGYRLLDKKYAAAGSNGQLLDQAQALIMKEADGSNNAVFMLNGDWFLNEVKANYKNSLNQIEFMNVPVISALGVEVFGAGTKYALDDATCDDVLSLLCKLADEGKSIAEMKAGVASTFNVTLDDADVQRIAEARGTCFARGIEHLAFIPKGCTKVDIVAKALRMMASDDFANTFMAKANAASPYTKNISVESTYKFVNEAKDLVAHEYFRPINSRISNLRFAAFQTDFFLPHVANSSLTSTLITENSSKSYRELAQDLIASARAEAEKKWNNYKK